MGREAEGRMRKPMSISYNVFISWSGERSLAAAEALRGWLPKVLQAAKPWMSATDIEKGTRGLSEVVKALDGIKVGISCITLENLSAPWLLFEAGGLSKTVDDKTRLCTYLLDGISPTDVTGPLSMFQASRADRDDTMSLLHSINRAISTDPIPAPDLDDVFAAMWPQLEKKLQALAEPRANVVQPKRKMEDMVTEILELVRAEAGGRESLLSWMDSVMGTTIEQRPSTSSVRLGEFARDRALANLKSAGGLPESQPGELLARAFKRTQAQPGGRLARAVKRTQAHKPQGEN